MEGIPQADKGSWPPSGGRPPFIKATFQNNQTEIEGDARCKLGSPVRNDAGNREDGVFARWDWDGETLTATVDRLGFYNLFVYQDGDTVSLSPSLLQLVVAGARLDPDHRALAVFHRLGLFLNNDTPFRQIKTLPPSGRLVWTGGKLEITGGIPAVPRQTISREAAIEGFIELPRQSIRTILDNQDEVGCLPLSGGRDSRHLLLELLHQGRKPAACLTFQQTPGGLDSEAQAARAICVEAGVRHHVLGQPRPRLPELFSALVLTSLCSDEHSQMLPIHDFLRTCGGATFDGIGGDVLTNPEQGYVEIDRLIRAGSFTETATSLVRGHANVLSRTGAKNGPGDLYSPDREEEAIDYIASAISDLSEYSDPYQAFWFWHRTRREISFVSSSMFASAGAVYCPFLDSEFVEFGLSLPLEVTGTMDLHDEAMARAFPRFSSVPFAESFARPNAGRSTLRSRVSRVVSGMKLLSGLQQDSRISSVVSYLRGAPDLHRRPAEVLMLHDLILRNLSPEFAESLLQTNAKIRSRWQGERPVDTFDPGR